MRTRALYLLVFALSILIHPLQGQDTVESEYHYPPGPHRVTISSGGNTLCILETAEEMYLEIQSKQNENPGREGPTVRVFVGDVVLRIKSAAAVRAIGVRDLSKSMENPPVELQLKNVEVRVVDLSSRK